MVVKEVHYCGDMEKTMERIKTQIDDMCKSRIEKKREKDAFKEGYKNWDGCVDLKTKRNDRLGKIL